MRRCFLRSKAEKAARKSISCIVGRFGFVGGRSCKLWLFLSVLKVWETCIFGNCFEWLFLHPHTFPFTHQNTQKKAFEDRFSRRIKNSLSFKNGFCTFDTKINIIAEFDLLILGFLIKIFVIIERHKVKFQRNLLTFVWIVYLGWLVTTKDSM